MSATNNTYTPQLGSIPADSLIALAKSGTGRMASAALLEAIGQPSGYAGLSSCLALCVEHQLLEKTRDGHLTFWSITAQGLTVARELSAISEQPAIAPSAASVLRPVARVPKTEDSSTDFALTANGRLVIEANGRQVILDKDQAEKLIEYIDAQRGIEWEAA